MAFCSRCGASIPDGAAFCAACGLQSGAAQEAPVRRAGKLHCPQCKSYNFSTTTESSVSGAISAGGSIRATSFSNTHRNYWMCADCGTKFRNIQNLEDEIHKSRNNPLIATIVTVIGALLTVFLWVMSSNSPIGGFLFLPYLLALGGVTLVCFIYIFVYKNRNQKMKEELAYLKQNCFD